MHSVGMPREPRVGIREGIRDGNPGNPGRTRPSLGNGGTPQTNMIASDATGNVRWTVPNETPQIATADGGVITQSGTTYDQSGNATGQINLFTHSWTGWEYTGIDSVSAFT